MNVPAKIVPALCIVAIPWSQVASAAITTFGYTQTDVSTGAGMIAAPAPSLVGGVTIIWQDTPMPQASVRDPARRVPFACSGSRSMVDPSWQS
jgi:hypothetical protein